MYVNIEELDKIIKVLSTPYDLNKINYKDIDNECKLNLIEKAVSIIDAQLFIGRKVSNNQECAFPRIIDGLNTFIPISLKYATVSLILKDLKISNNKRLQLQSEGVVSIDTNGVKESYVNNNNMDNVWLGYIQRYLY